MELILDGIFREQMEPDSLQGQYRLWRRRCGVQYSPSLRASASALE